jgi:hypothetical protein
MRGESEKRYILLFRHVFAYRLGGAAVLPMSKQAAEQLSAQA